MTLISIQILRPPEYAHVLVGTLLAWCGKKPYAVLRRLIVRDSEFPSDWFLISFDA
jgi:hypothetical protein